MQTNSKEQKICSQNFEEIGKCCYLCFNLWKDIVQKIKNKKNAKKPCSIEFRTLEHFCEK